jgi:hypothetical protein
MMLATLAINCLVCNLNLVLSFLNPNLYSARVQLGTEAVTDMIDYVLCSNMCGENKKQPAKTGYGQHEIWNGGGLMSAPVSTESES